MGDAPREVVMRAIRSRVTYANVMATIAVFIALGGTGYAAFTLPKNSVGTKQLKTGAVRSKDIHNRTIRLSDVSRSARKSLKGQTGAQGPAGADGTALRAAVSSGGVAAAGNSTTVAHVSGTNVYGVQFGKNTAACVATATLAAVQAGPTLEQPEPGRVTVEAKADRVDVKTFAANGTPREQPFNVAVSC
jgi:hypothetical protein